MAGIFREIVKAATRSSGWSKVRKQRLELDGKRCRACGKKGPGLQVHHIKPFHLHPELELDVDNTITHCGRCHLILGHLDNWKSWNIDVIIDSLAMLLRIKSRPKP